MIEYEPCEECEYPLPEGYEIQPGAKLHRTSCSIGHAARRAYAQAARDAEAALLEDSDNDIEEEAK